MTSGWKHADIDGDHAVHQRSSPMIEYSHCDSYYVNKTKFTYWSVRDGLTDTLLVNVLAFLVSIITLSHTIVLNPVMLVLGLGLGLGLRGLALAKNSRPKSWRTTIQCSP